jgi:hypothetical protein
MYKSSLGREVMENVSFLFLLMTKLSIAVAEVFVTVVRKIDCTT